MLIVFKSRATADVLMFGKVAEKLLAVLGKDPQDRQGIVTVAQLPEAIAALQRAIDEDKYRQSEQEEDDDEPRGMTAAVGLAQRAVPLLDTLKAALAEEEPVIWQPGE